MTLHVGGIHRLLHADQVEERAALEAVERTGREALAEMHRMLGVLRAPDPPPNPPPPPGSPASPSCSNRPARRACRPTSR